MVSDVNLCEESDSEVKNTKFLKSNKFDLMWPFMWPWMNYDLWPIIWWRQTRRVVWSWFQSFPNKIVASRALYGTYISHQVLVIFYFLWRHNSLNQDKLRCFEIRWAMSSDCRLNFLNPAIGSGDTIRHQIKHTLLAVEKPNMKKTDFLFCRNLKIEARQDFRKSFF